MLIRHLFGDRHFMPAHRMQRGEPPRGDPFGGFKDGGAVAIRAYMRRDGRDEHIQAAGQYEYQVAFRAPLIDRLVCGVGDARLHLRLNELRRGVFQHVDRLAAQIPAVRFEGAGGVARQVCQHMRKPAGKVFETNDSLLNEMRRKLFFRRAVDDGAVKVENGGAAKWRHRRHIPGGSESAHRKYIMPYSADSVKGWTPNPSFPRRFRRFLLTFGVGRAIVFSVLIGAVMSVNGIQVSGGRHSAGQGAERMNKPLKVFISYAHKNTESKDRLVMALDVLGSEGVIETWDESKIQPGERWRDAISNNLADSDMLLYLVSADSLASEYQNKELADALHNKDIRVVPVILEQCDWRNHELSDFEVLPYRGKPINKWDSESAGWQNVVEGVREVVDRIRSQSELSSETLQAKLHAELAFQRSNLLALIRQQDAAIEAYSDSIELNPTHADAYNNRGRTYADKGDLDSAIREYTKAIELNPNFAAAYNNRGSAYFIKDDLDNALADFTSAIAIKPDFAMAYDNRAKVWFLRQELEKAVLDLASARARSGV